MYVLNELASLFKSDPTFIKLAKIILILLLSMHSERCKAAKKPKI